MNYYFAPLEGITGYIYRNAYHDHFEAPDKYFTPFLVPNQNRRFKSKEWNDILPENNEGLYIVPQLLTNKADEFLWAAQELEQRGFTEVNLNLGCPSRTVVAKGKGSGFLDDPEELDRFLEQICAGTNLAISVKTRLGLHDPEEFYDLLPVFNRYPLKELIIHPRIQQDYYQNTPNLAMFETALNTSTNPVVYNGDLCSPNDLHHFQEQFPAVRTVMIGRGILQNPGLIGECKGQPRITKTQLRAFHDRLYGDYRNTLSGDRNVLFRMKEIWLYLHVLFTNPEKYFKKIKKAEKCSQYDQIIDQFLQNKISVAARITPD